MSMAWLLLILAGLCEVGWSAGLKLSNGFTHIGWSIATVIAIIASMVFLGLAVKTLPMGTAYGVWVGIGAVGAAVVGIVSFGEPATPARMFFIALMVVAIVGLKATSPE
jgi:quaternary ammonium compound-resistance protein SugE